MTSPIEKRTPNNRMTLGRNSTVLNQAAWPWKQLKSYLEIGISAQNISTLFLIYKFVWHIAASIDLEPKARLEDSISTRQKKWTQHWIFPIILCDVLDLTIFFIYDQQTWRIRWKKLLRNCETRGQNYQRHETVVGNPTSDWLQILPEASHLAFGFKFMLLHLGDL